MILDLIIVVFLLNTDGNHPHVDVDAVLFPFFVPEQPRHLLRNITTARLTHEQQESLGTAFDSHFIETTSTDDKGQARVYLLSSERTRP